MEGGEKVLGRATSFLSLFQGKMSILLLRIVNNLYLNLAFGGQ